MSMRILVPPPVRAGRRVPLLSRWWRRNLTLLHVISSVGWLGVTIGNLTLAVTGVATADPSLQHGVYLTMRLLDELILLPISFTAFVTGLALALGTQWGLVRWYWVLVKFGLTLIAVLLTPFSLLPGVRDLAEQVVSVPPGRLVDGGSGAVDLVVAGCVSLTMYLTATVLSVHKPWGRTRYGANRAGLPSRAVNTP